MRLSVILSTALFLSLFAAVGCKDEGGAKGGDSADKIGVAECDEYISKYSACLADNVPDEAKSAMKTGMDTMVSSWKEAAKTDEGKKGLAMGCKAALDGAKQAMSAYNCKW